MPSSHRATNALSQPQVLSLEPVKPPGSDGIIVVIVCVILALTLAAGLYGTRRAFAEHDTRERRRLFAGAAVFTAFFLALGLALRFIAAPEASLGFVVWALIGSVAIISIIAAAGWLLTAWTSKSDGSTS